MAPRSVNYALKPIAIDNAKPREKAYALTDGGGLYIEILPTGSKVWRFKYHLEGKREKVTIGRYPSWKIKDARDRHAVLREMVDKGESPAKTKQTDAVERRAEEASAQSFQSFAQLWIEETLFARSPGYRSQLVRWLDAYVYPAIGGRPLGEVMPVDVLRIVEARRGTPVAAERIRVTIQQIYNHAIRKLLVTTNPATPLRGVIKRQKVVHHRHLSERELKAWWPAVGLQGAHFGTITAAKLLLLTMVRKGELLKSKWPEFDLDAAVWDIPKERMKMKVEHRVFLSRQAVELLRQLKALDAGQGGYVFPSIFRGSVHMSLETLNKFFDRVDIGVPEFSPHGTRGTAATLLREHGFGRDVVELLLAHAEKNQSVAAYTHAELAPERRRALQFLADYVEELASS